LPALFIFFAFSCYNATAGWYEVTNYVGRIGEYPIHFSIQKLERYGGLNILGSYYYDRYMAPIPLYGKLNENGRLSLCEIHSNDEYRKVIINGSKVPVDTSGCPFQIIVGNQSATGKWANGKRNYEVALNETARLDNTGDTLSIAGKFEIPFWGQTAEHLFIGFYTLEARPMVKVVNKRSNAVIQVIYPEKHGCEFGFSMTPIYMNIEGYGSESYISHTSEQIFFQCYARLADIILHFRLNMSSGKFDLISP
jgi:hypothetical protein